MAFTQIQTFQKATKSDGTGSQVVLTMTTQPEPGSLLVALMSNGDAGGDITVSSFSDDIGDAGAWTPFSTNPVPITLGSGINYRGWWKVVGTPSGGGSAVQCTITGTQALMLFVAEYGDDVAPVAWSVIDGPIFDRNVSPNFPADAGDVTVPGAAVLVGFSANQNQHWNAGTGFTRWQTSGVWKADAVEDRLVTTGGTYAIDWSTSTDDDTWVALGIAFGVAAGGSSSIPPVRSQASRIAPLMFY